MFRAGGKTSLRLAARVYRHLLPIVVNGDQAFGGTHTHLLAHQGIRGAVEMTVEFDMVVDIHFGGFPGSVFVRAFRQARAAARFDNRASKCNRMTSRIFFTDNLAWGIASSSMLKRQNTRFLGLSTVRFPQQSVRHAPFKVCGLLRLTCAASTVQGVRLPPFFADDLQVSHNPMGSLTTPSAVIIPGPKVMAWDDWGSQ